MRKKLRGLSIRVGILFALLLLVSGFFGYLLFNGDATSEYEQAFQSSLVTSEAVYIMLALCLILILALVWLMLILIRSGASIHKQIHEQTAPKKKKKSGPPRFSMLNRIDEDMKTYVAPPYNNEITLEELCVRFRHFAAGQLHLYYDLADIRRFVAGLGVTRLIILQGMSGTGKTSLAYAVGQFLQNDSVVVPIQPMWKERSDMIGYFNEFTKRFNETTMLRKMYEAGYRKDLYITVLDEVNISRIEYYFAEFLSLLELPDEEKRYLDVVSDVWSNDPVQLKDGKIKLPPNMWFVGTANNDDSTFAISDKVYDRAMVLNLDRKCLPYSAPQTEPLYLSYDHWSKLIEDAKQSYMLSKEGEEKIQKLDAYLIEHFHISFGNRIMKQIREYVSVYRACGGSENEALDDIFSKKVLRKLESQNPTYIRNSAEGLINFLDELFGKEALPQCHALLVHFQQIG